jgi:hypothetical protein
MNLTPAFSDFVCLLRYNGTSGLVPKESVDLHFALLVPEKVPRTDISHVLALTLCEFAHAWPTFLRPAWLTFILTRALADRRLKFLHAALGVAFQSKPSLVLPPVLPAMAGPQSFVKFLLAPGQHPIRILCSLTPTAQESQCRLRRTVILFAVNKP